MQADKHGHVDLPEMNCPYCAAVIDCTTSANGQPLIPSNGDISLCFQCAQPCIFVVGALGVSVRKPTADEKAEILSENAEVIAGLLQFNADRPRG